MMKQRLLVDVANRQKMRLPVRRIKAMAKEVFEKEGKEGEISIAFVNDNEMRDLNKRFKGKDRPTDVLAFLLNPKSQILNPKFLFGEVIISTERAKRQAREYGISFIEEIITLLIHGLLHLLGYKHSKMMKQKEEFYFKKCQSLV
ncbi:MAG: rRNA maturation RNase YbeY [bacterium]